MRNRISGSSSDQHKFNKAPLKHCLLWGSELHTLKHVFCILYFGTWIQHQKSTNIRLSIFLLDSSEPQSPERNGGFNEEISSERRIRLITGGYIVDSKIIVFLLYGN